MQETQVQSLGWEYPLEKEMTAHSSMGNPVDRDSDGLQSMGFQKSDMTQWLNNSNNMVALYLAFWGMTRGFTRWLLEFTFALATYIKVSLSSHPHQYLLSDQIRSDQSLSRVWLLVTPWIAACQASLSITNSRSPPKFMSIKLVMPSSHFILCRPLLLLPLMPPSIRVLSNESTRCMRWPKYWSFSFNVSPSNEHPGLISFRIDCLDLLAVQGTLQSFSNTTIQKHQFFGAQLSL